MYTFDSTYTKALNVCGIIERITGRTLHHGETHYDYSEVFVCMDERLVEEIISVGSSEGEYEDFAAENGLSVTDDQTRWDFAAWILEGSFFIMTE